MHFLRFRANCCGAGRTLLKSLQMIIPLREKTPDVSILSWLIVRAARENGRLSGG
jgi:hypothetical protein